MYRFLLSGILFLFFFFSSAQQDTTAAQYFHIADSIFEANDVDSAATHYLVRCWDRAGEEDISDPMFLGELSELCGQYLYNLDEEKSALDFLKMP